ncbi:hypothetical protein D7X87_22875 [bacterium D16-54]|jgi:hypothetical protein|nr:hypothetical protein D7X87_22875 [bacterium D16-54]RKJ10541.1 hypothetical protein D7X65_23275 [bacterium D16-56]
MMKQEFEELAKVKVTEEVYSKVIEPMYLATDLPKREFIKLLNLKALAIQEGREKDIKKMCVRDRSGYMKTPNGCYCHIRYVELAGVDIATGKYIVKPLRDKDFRKLAENGHDLDLNTSFDFDYTQCIDTRKKPIIL